VGPAGVGPDAELDSPVRTPRARAPAPSPSPAPGSVIGSIASVGDVEDDAGGVLAASARRFSAAPRFSGTGIGPEAGDDLRDCVPFAA